MTFPMELWSMLTPIILVSFYVSSPLTACLMLASLSMLLGMVFFCSCQTWVSYSIIILFVGGMMVLFLYICCMSSSPKFKVGDSIGLVVISVAPFLGWLVVKQSTYTMMWSGGSISEILSVFSMLSLFFLMFYLLIGLVVSTKIANKFGGPLKPAF